MPNSTEKPLVAIVGGGPAGMSLALALHRAGIDSEIFDARSRADQSQDKRALALSYGSRQTLEWLGVWNDIDATPITSIHVSQRGGFGRTRITAEMEGVPALGYVAAASSLIAALDAKVRTAGIVYHEQTRVENVAADGGAINMSTTAGEFKASLVAYAEGAVGKGERIASRDYSQHAVVCTVTTSEPHNNYAWERFTPQGPVALLPFNTSRDSGSECSPRPQGEGLEVRAGQQYAAVITCPPDVAEELAALDDKTFITRLQERFGSRVTFTAAGPRNIFPLGLRYRRDTAGPRQVWLGNAAQTLHPVAGQGFNLALRDIRQLSRSLAGAADPGDEQVLARYARSRRLDRRGTISTTDTLVRLFSNDNALLRHARGIGLIALDLFPPARSFLARRMMFGARAWP